MKTVIQQLILEIDTKIKNLRLKHAQEEKAKIYKEAELYFLHKMLLELEGNYIHMCLFSFFINLTQ